MKKNRIVWGIILFGTAVALLLFAFIPQLHWAGVSIWKLLLAAVLVYWLLNNVIFGKTLAEHFQVFLPLGILFLVFQKEIALLATGREEKLVSDWTIILAAVLLTIAVDMIFSHTTTRKGGHNNRMSSSVYYLDAQLGKHMVANWMGDAEVCFENTDLPSSADPITLELNNKMGNVTVKVPRDWTVVLDLPSKLGHVEVRPNQTAEGRKLILQGENKMGNIEVIS